MRKRSLAAGGKRCTLGSNLLLLVSIIYVLAAAVPAMAAKTALLRLHEPRYGHAAVVVGEDIYVIGGYSATGFARCVERIRPAQSLVEQVDAPLIPRGWVSAVADGTNIYIFGGLAGPDPRRSCALEIWNPSTGRIREGTPLPCPRMAIAAVYWRGRIYAIGGRYLGRTLRSRRVDIYDIAADRWLRGTDMPTRRECDAVVYDGRIYAVGGYNGRSPVAAVEVYDPASDRWEKLPQMPFPISAHHLAVVGDTLFAFGDYRHLSRVAACDLRRGEWYLPALEYQPARHTAVVHCGREVLVIGGNQGRRPPYVDAIQRFPVETLLSAARHTPGPEICKEIAEVKPGDIPRSTRKLIRAWCERLREIRTLKFTESESITFLEDETNREEYLDLPFSPYPQLTRVAVDLDRQRLHIRNPIMEVSCDGTNLYLISRHDKTWLRRPLPDLSADAMGEMWFWISAFLGQDVSALLLQDPEEYLADQAFRYHWRLHVPEGANRTSWIIDGSIGSAGRAEQMRLEIDQRTGIILKRCSWSDNTPKKAPGGQPGPSGKTAYVRERSDIEVNRPLTADDFEFAIPEGAIQVNEFTELFRPRREESSFALRDHRAPSFTLSLLDGRTFSLSDCTGRVVVINFWAPWCSPCRKELPLMQRLSRAVVTQDVVVLGIALPGGDDTNRVAELVAEYGVTYPIAVDTAGVARAYSIACVPTTLLIDQHGIIRSSHQGAVRHLDVRLKREINALLAGRSLSEVKTAAESEAKAPRRCAPCWGPPVVMDRAAFTKVWEIAGAPPQADHFFSPSLFQVNTSPYLAVAGTSSVQVIRLKDGAVIARFDLPSEWQAISTNSPRYAAVIRSGDSVPRVVVMITMVESSKCGDKSCTRLNGSILKAFSMDGKLLWTRRTYSPYMGVRPIPVGPGRDWLLLQGFSEFMLIDADGKRRARQRYDYRDRVIIADVDGDECAELLIVGHRIACYHLKL